MIHTLFSIETVRAHGLAIAFFIILTLIVTWLLTLHFTDQVPGWYIADNYKYPWKIRLTWSLGEIASCELFSMLMFAVTRWAAQ